MKVSRDILSLTPYRPGKPISEAKRELGLNTVYKLASNESPLGPSPKVISALHNNLEDLGRYPDAAAYEMVEAYSQFVGVPQSHVAFGNGSNELIDLLIRIYCEPGESILTSDCAFVAYRISAQAARVQTKITPLTSDGRFDLHAMAEKLREDSSIRLVFLANPNNPTGTYVGQETLEQFLKICAGYEVLVVLDEAYVEFVRAKDYVNGFELRKIYPHVVVLRTMSKVYGIAALRVGFAVAQPEVIDLINRVRSPFNVNSLAQIATVEALKDQIHVRRVLDLTWRGLDQWQDALTKMGLPFLPSQGNFILLDTKRDADLVFNSMIREGVITRPVKNYGLMSQLRISIGLDHENRAAIEALQKAVQSLPLWSAT